MLLCPEVTQVNADRLLAEHRSAGRGMTPVPKQTFAVRIDNSFPSGVYSGAVMPDEFP